MKLIYALGKPRVSLLNILICTFFVSALFASGLLVSAPLWVLWVFYSVAGLEAVLAILEMRRKP